MKVLITGATGSLGTALVREVASAGHQARVMSRGPRPPSTQRDVEWAQADVASGDGVREAVARIDAVLHAATDPRNSDAVDVTGTRNLVAAARSAHVAHVVYVSIVGIDEIPIAYYKSKRAAEDIVRWSHVPFTILRATQFHSLLDGLLATAARLPLVLLLPADFKFQTVSASDVAGRLVARLADGPRGRVADFGGPDVLSLGDMARTWMDLTGIRKTLIPVPIPGRAAAGFRAGRNTAPTGARGVIGWQQWLRRRYSSQERQ